MTHAYSRRLKSISFFLVFILVFDILFSSAEWFAYGDSNAIETKESSETLPNDLSKSEVLEKGTDYTIFKNPEIRWEIFILDCSISSCIPNAGGFFLRFIIQILCFLLDCFIHFQDRVLFLSNWVKRNFISLFL